MTLICSKYPTHFEGEIQCQIEWESDNDNAKHHDAKSVQTNTVGADIGEYLFMRLRKRSKIVSSINSQFNLIDQDSVVSGEQGYRDPC